MSTYQSHIFIADNYCVNQIEHQAICYGPLVVQTLKQHYISNLNY